MNNISLWIITSFLAIALVVDGHWKLGSSPVADVVPARASVGGSSGASRGAAAGAAYLSRGAYRTVGVLQWIAAIGLMVPGLLRTATVLVPLSACGVIALLLWSTDIRDGGIDRRRVAGVVVAIAAAAFVAYGRFGDWAL